MTKSQLIILIITILLPYYLTFLANGEIVFNFTLAYLAASCFVFGGAIIFSISFTKDTK